MGEMLKAESACSPSILMVSPTGNVQLRVSLEATRHRGAILTIELVMGVRAYTTASGASARNLARTFGEKSARPFTKVCMISV